MKRLDFVELTRIKGQRKTLRAGSGPLCEPPNRPCGGRCIPPNWECHTGSGAGRQAATPYRSNVIGAAGSFEAAGRDVLALARPGSRRNVSKTAGRVVRNLYKGLADLTPYPKLSEKQRAGRTEEEVQALETQEYVKRLNRTWGLALGAGVSVVLGSAVLANRQRIARTIRTYATRNKALDDLIASGAEWGVRQPTTDTFILKRLESIFSGSARISGSTMEEFRKKLTAPGLIGSDIPFYQRGPLGTHTEIDKALKGAGSFQRLYRGSNLKSFEQDYRRVLDDVARAAARKPSGTGGLTPEDIAFRDMFDVMTKGGTADNNLDAAITRNLYLKYLNQENAGASQSISSLLTERYAQEKRAIESRIRTGLISKFGADPNITIRDAKSRYYKLGSLDRMALFMDDSLPAPERVASAAVASEWASAFAMYPDVGQLAKRDIDLTKASLRKLRESTASSIKTPRSPLDDVDAVEFLWGNDNRLPAVRATASQDIQEKLRAGVITKERAAELTKIAGARAAMRDYLNRIRYEQGMPLELLTREDLLRSMKSSGIEIKDQWVYPDGRPKKSLSRSSLLTAIDMWSKQNPDSPLIMEIEGTVIKYNGSLRQAQEAKADSAARLDLFKGKPCGKSFIPRSHKCGEQTRAQPKQSSGNPAASFTAGSLGAVAGGAAAVGGAVLLTSMGVKGAAIQRYRKNVAKSALEADKLARQMVDEMRQSAAARLKKPVQDVTPFEASVYNFNDKGFDRGFNPDDRTPHFYGQTPSSKGAVVMLSYADDNRFTRRGQGSHLMAQGGAFQEIWGEHDILPYANNISQPRRSTPNDLEVQRQQAFIKRFGKAAPVAERAVFVDTVLKRFDYLRRNIDRGFNPDAVRAAAFVAAQRRLTGKPVNILSYSNGGNVASEALAILNEMGYRDVRVVNVAGPTFGIFKHDRQQMRTWVSPGDEFLQYSKGAAFQGSEVRKLDNPNIPHGLKDKIDPNSPKHGKDFKRHIKEGNSYMLDKQLQREAYTFLTVNKTRSAELTDEYIWRVAENKPIDGDLANLLKDDAKLRRDFQERYRRNPQQATEWLRDAIENSMLETWYGGYDPKQVKRRGKALRQELDKQVQSAESPTKTDSVQPPYTFDWGWEGRASLYGLR